MIGQRLTCCFCLENDCQLEKSFNQSNENLLIRNRYNRGFINEFLAFLKQSISPRFVDMMYERQNNVHLLLIKILIFRSSKVTPPLRRSSRIRRAPNKCLCSSCSTNGINHEHSFSNDQLENETFIHLINHYHQLFVDTIQRERKENCLFLVMINMLNNSTN